MYTQSLDCINSFSQKCTLVKYTTKTDLHMKMTIFWDAAQCSLVDTDQCFNHITLIMKTVYSFEMLVNTYHTELHNIPQPFYTHCCESFN